MNKKIILIILLLIPLNILAEEKTSFSLNEVTASSGNNVTINLDIKDNPEFGMLAAKINYDKEKIEYVSSEIKGLKNAILKGAEDNKKGQVVLYAIALDKKKLMKDSGTILKVEFKIKENVTEDIPLNLDVTDFGTDEVNLLNYDTKDGIIHIKKEVDTVSKEKTESITSKIKQELKEKGINEEEITWETSDNKVATIDEEGNIEFKKDGNVEIEAKDKDGNTVYKKDYFVKDKIKSKNKIIIPAISITLIIIIILILVKKHEKK